MRAWCVAVTVSAVSLLAVGSSAQTPDSTERSASRAGLSAVVAAEVERLYNAPASVRARDRLEVAAGRRIDGHLTVLGGPLVVAGHIAGRVIAVNADVILAPTARIDGDLIVVGGDLEGRALARVAGETRVYRQRLRYTLDGETLIAEESPASDDSWWRRWERRRTSRNSSRILVASAGAYNRVEGLPVQVGPQIRQVFRRSTFEVSAMAIARTASSFASESLDVGHDVRMELRTRGRDGVALGARLYNVVEAVESWQQSDLEVGLAAFLLRRDYRDYFARRGGRLEAIIFTRALGGDLTVSYGHERWGARIERDPFTLFRGTTDWRPNPTFDVGRMHVVDVALRGDTRNTDDRPRSGWYVAANVERATGDLTSIGATTPTARASSPGRIAYTRGLVDLRRYNRLSPGSQLNLRLVTGGWLGGDELPLQRRLSVDGPGALPGYDFRMQGSGSDEATCSTGGFVPGGQPAQCERIALIQAEYRGDLRFDLFGRSGWDDVMQAGEHAAWIVFFDAGRGWLVRSHGSAAGYGTMAVPPLSTFRTDAGIGLDLRLIGFYVAKALSEPGQPLNFFVRLRHRF